MRHILSQLLALVGTVLALSSADTTCPSDPFHHIARRAVPAAQEPVCLLASSPFEATADILSFEEWKAEQLALQVNTIPAADPAQPIITNESNVHSLNGLSNDTFPAPAATVPDASPMNLPAQAPPEPRRVSLTDRYNFAAIDCSARIHSAHRAARSASSVLSSKKDKYMLSPCAARDQFVVVELCDDIHIDTVQLANFEFFSGVFRDFRVSVAAGNEEWTVAGVYQAKNVRGVQSFHPQVDLPQFYRYIRIDFLTHYGSEFYCPISLLRVYGLTQMEKFKEELAEEGSRSSPEPVAAKPAEPLPATVPQPVVEEPTHTAVSQTMPETSPVPPQTALPEVALDLVRDVAVIPEAVRTDQCSPRPSTTQAPMPNETAPLAVAPTASAIPQPTVGEPIAGSGSTVVGTEGTLSLSAPAQSAGSSPGVSHPVANASSPPRAKSPVPDASATVKLPAPGMTGAAGESIYRTIMNRLSALEANASLYARYAEQQTLSIRAALRRLEEDVGRLEGSNKAQMALFTRTLEELERARAEFVAERGALREQVRALADEVVLEKRVGIAQLCLLVAVLIFMTITRGSPARAELRARRIWSRSADLGRWMGSGSTITSPQRHIPPLQIPIHTSPEPSTPRARTFTSAAQSAALRRPRTPRLRRANSHTADDAGERSARRLARTAHLHEVRRAPAADKENGGALLPAAEIACTPQRARIFGTPPGRGSPLGVRRRAPSGQSVFIGGPGPSATASVMFPSVTANGAARDGDAWVDTDAEGDTLEEHVVITREVWREASSGSGSEK